MSFIINRYANVRLYLFTCDLVTRPAKTSPEDIVEKNEGIGPPKFTRSVRPLKEWGVEAELMVTGWHKNSRAIGHCGSKRCQCFTRQCSDTTKLW